MNASAIKDMDRFAMLDDGCWEWSGPKYPNGYGRCYVGSGRRLGAHRVAYELANGPIPDGLVINHLCENKACVRPGHLEAVTPQANSLYSDTPARRNADKTQCHRGHPFDAANTMTASGRRRCRTCHNAQVARYRALNRR